MFVCKIYIYFASTSSCALQSHTEHAFSIAAPSETSIKMWAAIQ